MTPTAASAPQFFTVSLGGTDQAKPIHDFVGNKIGIVALDLAMVLVIIVATILHKRSQRGRKIFRLILPDQIHHVVRNQSREPAHTFASHASGRSRPRRARPPSLRSVLRRVPPRAHPL